MPSDIPVKLVKNSLVEINGQIFRVAEFEFKYYFSNGEPACPYFLSTVLEV